MHWCSNNQIYIVIIKSKISCCCQLLKHFSQLQSDLLLSLCLWLAFQWQFIDGNKERKKKLLQKSHNENLYWRKFLANVIKHCLLDVQQENWENVLMVVVRLKLRWLHVDFISIFIKGLSSYGHQRPTTNHYCFYGHSKLPTIKHTCDASILYFLIY